MSLWRRWREAGCAVMGLVIAIALAGCASPAFVGRGENVMPPVLTATDLVASDGATLPLRKWVPPLGRPVQGVVLALHGFNDYSNSFEETGDLLSQRGLAVYAIDQRGFGAAPHPGRWAGTEALVSDVRDAVTALRAKHPQTRVVLFGESMGGAVAMAALTAKPLVEVDGTVLSAPAVWGRATMPWYQRAALAVAARAVPGLPLTGKGLNIWPSDNIPMLRDLARDPLVIKETRPDTLYGLCDLMDRAYDVVSAGALPGPVLWLYGKRDEIVPPGPTRAGAARLDPDKGQRFALYPDGWHMLFRDLSRQAVIEDIATWVLDPNAPLPSGAEVTPPSQWTKGPGLCRAAQTCNR